MCPSNRSPKLLRHLDDEDLDAISVLLDQAIINRLDILDTRLRSIMATLADLTAEDSALNDEVNAVIAALQNQAALIAQLQAAIGSGNLTADQQATVDNLFGQLTTQHDEIAAALAPPVAAPAPEPAPADVPPAEPPA